MRSDRLAHASRVLLAAALVAGLSATSPAEPAPNPGEFTAAPLAPVLAGPPDEGQRTVAFRAVWADAFSVGFKSNSQISSLVSRAVSGRYNAIIAEVLAYYDTAGGGHGAYWNSAIVPKATDISGGIDPLAVLVSQAQAAGLEVHAWIVPYRVSTAWPPAGNALLAGHPEWLMVPLASMGGGPAPVGGKYTFDPGCPAAQEYILSVVRELVTNYAIDGINYDYIRYVQTDAGYPANSTYAGSGLARFRELTGYQGTPPPTGNTSWNDFRRRTIDELVRRTRAEIPAITSNPRQPLRFTCDLICFGNAPSSFESSDAYALFQNWRYWMERGWLDAGCPMNYKRDWDPPEDTWFRNWVNAAVNWRYQRHMFCGQANYLNPKADSIDQLAYIYSHNANGSVNYSYDATADENMDDVPEADWTWYTYVAQQLFTSAATLPTMPWRNPATATEGTLWGRVTDPATGDPLDGATVSVSGVGAVVTDGNGYYVLTLIPAAPAGTAYDVTASNLGCAPVAFDAVPVLPGQLTRLDIEMCNSQPPAGDMDADGDIDYTDFLYVAFCLQGPGVTYNNGHVCLNADADEDGDDDLADFANFQRSFNP